MSPSDRGDSDGSKGSRVDLSSDDSSCVHILMGVVGRGKQSWADGRDSSSVPHSGLGSNCFGPILGSFPRSLLRGDDQGSVVTPEGLSVLRYTYDIPSHVKMVVPSSAERPDWVYPGWTVMYEYLFTMGARLPLPRLVLEACDYFKVSPSQLLPNVWRTLMAIQVFSELRGVHFSICEVLLAYSLEKHKTEKNRYQFKAICPLILDRIDSAKDWKSKYFLVPFTALGASSGSAVQESWQICICLKKKPRDVSKNSLEKIEWFLSYDEEERRYSTILTPSNLRESSLWSDIPAGLAMSRPYYPPLLREDAMEKFRQRKKQAIIDLGAERVDTASNVRLPTSAQARRMSKRHAHTDVYEHRGGAANLSSPSAIPAPSDLPKCRDQVEKLMSSIKDENELEEMGVKAVSMKLFDDAFSQLRTIFYLKEKLVQMAAELNEVGHERAAWQTEMTSIRKAYDEANGIINKLEASREKDAQRAAAECQALQDKVLALQTQIADVSCDTEIITRGAMALEFSKVKSPQTWDVTRYVSEFEEWKG